MAEMMKALQIVAPGKVEIVDVAVPEPGPDEVLVEVKAITACTQWDLTLLSGVDIFERMGFPKYPIAPGVPGHEMAGVVVARGSEASVFSPGDRVAAWDSRASQLPGRIGYYAQFAAVPEDCLLPIPDSLTFVEAAPLELGMCVAASVRQAGDLSGKRVAVGGAGAAGLVALQMAKALGARHVIAFDPVAARRELALALGVDDALDPVSEECAALRPGSADVGIECSGRAASAENLLRIATGGVHLFGVVHGQIRYTMDHWGRNVSLHGYPGHTRESAELALALMSCGAVRTKEFIGAEVPFEKYLEGMDMVKRGEIPKLCIIP